MPSVSTDGDETRRDSVGGKSELRDLQEMREEEDRQAWAAARRGGFKGKAPMGGRDGEEAPGAAVEDGLAPVRQVAEERAQEGAEGEEEGVEDAEGEEEGRRPEDGGGDVGGGQAVGQEERG
jgi:hypothetical protein